jgi:hypothetical protein
MQRQTQCDLLRQLHTLARHYAAACLSLQVPAGPNSAQHARAFDAERVLVAGCIAAVADAVLRVQVGDAPTRGTLELHSNYCTHSNTL